MDKKKLFTFIFIVFSIIVGTVLFTILAGGFTWDSIFVIIIVALFLVYGIPHFILNRNDQVKDDEYSKKLIRVAAARSYMISLYTWLALMFFDDLFVETHTQIGFGIGIMAVVFLINVLYIKFTGLKD